MKSNILSFVFSAIALSASAKAGTLDRYTPAVAKSVRQEFGGIRQDYFLPGRPVSDQVMMGLGIPNPNKLLPEGNTLISGCRRHSCDEKSAVIVTSAGAMLAAGMIYFSCSPKPGDRTRNCDFGPYFRIFLKKQNDRPDFVQELQDWAVRQGYKGAPETQILR